MERRSSKHWDVFICHAKEDKDAVARPLANALKSGGLDIWYDEFSLTLGDDLLPAIDLGIAKSNYGVVIFSPNFFAKGWPQKELEALFGREVQARRKIILPVRHNINQEAMMRYSPLLAGKVAASTSDGIDVVAEKILEIAKNPPSKSEQTKKSENEKFVNPKFKSAFSSKLENLVGLLTRKDHDYREVNYLIDMLIMVFKDRIEKWDVPSVKFATKELFMKLYKFSGGEGELCELYTIFKDLFSYAYSQRKHLLGSMIETFNEILFGSWIPNNDIERGEKAAIVMLRLGVDFLDEDLAVSNDCFSSIDNLAGDMFEPEILSKQILLGAKAFQKMEANPELRTFVEQLVDWVRINDQYAWDADIKTYLRDSIKYAEWEQEKYEINIEAFKRKYLFPALEQNIDEEIESYVEFLGEMKSEGDKDITFPAENLATTILAYEFLRPKISEEIKNRVEETKDGYRIEIFKRIAQSNNFLKGVYGGTTMITTFDELIKFFEANSDMENLGIGVVTYNFAIIEFKRKLKDDEKEALNKIAQKYGLKKEEFELTDQGVELEMDSLVYLGDNRNEMRKLVDFLKEINSILEIKSFSTGVTFGLREREK